MARKKEKSDRQVAQEKAENVAKILRLEATRENEQESRKKLEDLRAKKASRVGGSTSVPSSVASIGQINRLSDTATQVMFQPAKATFRMKQGQNHTANSLNKPRSL